MPTVKQINKLEGILTRKTQTWETDRLDDWCERHGVQWFWEWEQHLFLQMFDKEKNVISLVHGNTSSKRYFVVPIDLFEKSILLGDMPD